MCKTRCVQTAIDEVLREEARAITARWPAPRAQAALAVASLDERRRQISLAQAAEFTDVSRETVRRDRIRLLHALAESSRVRAGVEQLRELVLEHGGELAIDHAADLAYKNGLLGDRDALGAIWETLVEAGFLAPVIRDAEDQRVRVEVDSTRQAVARTLQGLSDGLPHNLVHEVGAEHAPSVRLALLADRRARDLGHLPGTWIALPAELQTESPAGRAMRRLLSSTGPLPWPDLLAAWARGRGRPPHGQIPADITVLSDWLDFPGIRIRSSATLGGQPVVEADAPMVELDKVGGFLRATLSPRADGLPRTELLEAAKEAGLQASSVAAALSYHPAVVQTQRGWWALRRSPDAPAVDTRLPLRGDKRRPRPRPTTYRWTPDGALVLQFSVPSGPSPVIAVPSAVAAILEGREFRVALDGEATSATTTVRGARAWGFGPALAQFGPAPGDRFDLAFDLLSGISTLGLPAQKMES